MENEQQKTEQSLLERAIAEAISGRLGYDALMDAFGRAAAEQVEVLAVRTPREQLQADGSPVVEFLRVPTQNGALWLCLTGPEHLQALSAGKGTIPTAVLTLGTLLSMAEDAGISGIVFNPDLQPNLSIGAQGLQELQRRAEQYLETCRQQKLREAGTAHRPGWIL